MQNIFNIPLGTLKSKINQRAIPEIFFLLNNEVQGRERTKRKVIISL